MVEQDETFAHRRAPPFVEHGLRPGWILGAKHWKLFVFGAMSYPVYMFTSSSNDAHFRRYITFVKLAIYGVWQLS